MKKIFAWIKSHKLISAIIFILILVIGFIFFQKSKTQNGYETIEIKTSDIQQILEVSGKVDAHEKANLHFAAASRLSWVGVKEGDEVRKWQAIATVDTRTLQKQLQADLNSFAKEFNDHDQTLDDYDYYGQSGISNENRRILENAQYDLNNVVITAEIRDLAIKLSSLVSPIKGVVTHIDEPIAGVTVGPTDLFQIVNPETLYFLAEVDESDVSLIKEGQTAQIILDAYIDETIQAKITSIDFASSVSDVGNTIYKIKLTLPNNENIMYRLGLNGDVNIILDQKDSVITIPLEALKYDDDQAFVETYNQNNLERRDIEVGIEGLEDIEVTNGLTEGDVVITDKN